MLGFSKNLKEIRKIIEEQEMDKQIEKPLDTELKRSNAIKNSSKFFSEDEKLKKFKKDIGNLDEIDSRLDELSKLVKELKEQKETIKESVMKYMNINGTDIVQLGDGKKYSLIKTSVKINPLTRKRLPEHLTRYYKTVEGISEDQAEEQSETVLKWIISTNDQKEERCSLKRICRKIKN